MTHVRLAIRVTILLMIWMYMISVGVILALASLSWLAKVVGLVAQ